MTVLMLRVWLLGWWLLTGAGGGAAEPDLPTLRHLYAAAVQDEAAVRRFYGALKTYNGPDATILAYRGVAEALLARAQWSPLAKLRGLKAAEKFFVRAVAADPQNVEARFLRFTVESNVPRYLGHSQHLADDRAHILRGARRYPDLGLDVQSLALIRDFMLRYGDCTPDEVRMLRAIAP